MATNNSAGQLTERVAFEQKGSAPDGYGGTTTAYVEQFTCRAGFQHLRGGEAVQAARLQGQHTLIIRVRASSLTKAVTGDWRVRDARKGTVYAIKDVEPETNGMFISFTCQSGATG
jgi:SPP1 family predicted phage head-tail adaptor